MNTNRWIWNNSNMHNNRLQYKCWHRSTSYKGGKDGRPAVEQLVAIRRRSLTSDDSRTGVQRTKTVQSTTQRLQRSLSFRTSPQESLHNRTTSPTCRAVDSLPTLTTTSEFLQTWLSAAGTITFKLFDAPLHESSAVLSTIFASLGRR